MNRFTTVFLVASVLSGCATSGQQEYYEAQLAAMQQKPLLRIQAEPGQSITGLQSIEVNMPNTGHVQQYVDPRVNLAMSALNFLSPVLGSWLLARESRLTVSSVASTTASLGSIGFNELGSLGQSSVESTASLGSIGFNELGSLGSTGFDSLTTFGNYLTIPSTIGAQE